jgi:hypothetical protein
MTANFIGQASTASPKLASLAQYSVSLQADSAHLSMLASSGNVTSFRAYTSGTFDPALNAAARNISSAIRAANLSANTTLQIRAGYNNAIAAYRTCNVNAAKAYALQKLSLFNQSIEKYQNESDEMASDGINASSLNQLLQSAGSQIVQPLSSAISKADDNASQISTALAEYCLFDGCRNGTNFHLAAHYELQKLQLELTYLQSAKNLSASSTAAAQAFLNNASSVLQAADSKAYAGSQSPEIFGNLTLASKAMQQARQQAAFTKARQAAQKLVASYQNAIERYQAAVGKLEYPVIDRTGINQTLSQAETAIIIPLQNAINASSNVTQLRNAVRSFCLENACQNGTNYHLGVLLRLNESQTYLAYLDARAANTTMHITVNQTALASAQGFLGSASSLISSVGRGQFSSAQTGQLDACFGNFTNALRSAFRVARPSAARGSSGATPRVRTANNSTAIAGNKRHAAAK